jgi:hypothetical protein
VGLIAVKPTEKQNNNDNNFLEEVPLRYDDEERKRCDQR